MAIAAFLIILAALAMLGSRLLPARPPSASEATMAPNLNGSHLTDSFHDGRHMTAAETPTGLPMTDPRSLDQLPPSPADMADTLHSHTPAAYGERHPPLSGQEPASDTPIDNETAPAWALDAAAFDTWVSTQDPWPTLEEMSEDGRFLEEFERRELGY